MSWFGDNWLDLAKLGIGAFSANKASKQAMDLKDLKNLWLYQNPDQNNPFYQSTLTNNGEGGTVRNTQFTPGIQAMFDQLVGALTDGSQGNQINRVDPGLFGAQEDYQRSRWNLGPGDGLGTPDPGDDMDIQEPDYGFKPQPGQGGNWQPGDSQTGGLGTQGPPGRQDPVFNGGDRPGSPTGEWWFGGNPGMGGGYGPGPSQGGGSNWDGRTGWDRFDNSGWNPFAWGDTHNASEAEKLFGQNDIGSLGGMEAPGVIASMLGSAFGLPIGSIYDMLDPNGFYDPNKNYFSPTNPDNPYGSDSDATRGLNDAFAPPPSSGIGDGVTNPAISRPTLPRDYNNMRGGRNNSITGNGAYGYATRLRPRGGYIDDPRFRQPLPDKIGEG